MMRSRASLSLMSIRVSRPALFSFFTTTTDRLSAHQSPTRQAWHSVRGVPPRVETTRTPAPSSYATCVPSGEIAGPKVEPATPRSMTFRVLRFVTRIDGRGIALRYATSWPSRLADGRLSMPTPAVSRRGAPVATPRMGSIGCAHTLLLTEALANAMIPDAAVVAWNSRLVPNVRRCTFDAVVDARSRRIDQR